MTIKGQVKYMMEHPYMAKAMQDPDYMEDLLFKVIFDTYTVCASNASKVFRQWKGLNTPEIYTYIRDMAPPENLNINMPVVPEDEDCVIVPIQRKEPRIVVMPERKIRVRCLPNPLQIVIDFPGFPSFSLMEG